MTSECCFFLCDLLHIPFGTFLLLKASYSTSLAFLSVRRRPLQRLRYAEAVSSIWCSRRFTRIKTPVFCSQKSCHLSWAVYPHFQLYAVQL